jgi:Outer membrane protein beta-barrel domain
MPVAAAVLLTAGTAAWAQNSPDYYAPRYEIGLFGGFQHWNILNGSSPTTNSLVSGGVGGIRATQDFAKYFGLEETWSIYAVNNVRFSTTGPYPVTSVAFGARNATVAAGPVVYFNPRDSKVRFFVTVGPSYISFWPTKDAKGFAQSPPFIPYRSTYLGGKDGVALMWGGGVKFNMSHKFGIRFDVKDFWTKNPNWNLPSFSSAPGQILVPAHQTAIMLQTTVGVEYRFGARPVPPAPPAPVTPPAPTPKDASISIAADQSDVCPGTPVRFTATTNLTSGAVFQWTVNGQPADGTNVLNFDTNNKPGGSYAIKATVRAPGFNDGTATSSINIKDYVKPSGSVTASPSTIPAGGTSQLNSSFNGQCGGTIKVATCTAAEGSISGDTFNSNGVQFDPNNNGDQSKSVLITCSTTDEKGGAGTATTTITVTKAANPQAVRLPDIVFAAGSSRVNNCGKRVLLEQLKTYTDKDPTGKVVFVGHEVDRESKKKGQHLDQERALNAAAVISAGTGICTAFAPSQIMVSATGTNQGGVDFQPNFCGTSATKERPGQGVSESDSNAKYRRVEVYFVPTGAQMPSTVTDAKDAVTLGVGKLGCPK